MRNGHVEPAVENDLIPPPPERGQHDHIRRVDRQIQDTRGGIGLPWQAVGLLGRLHYAAKISDEELRAGIRFRGDFTAAHLDRLQARDLSRPRIDGGRRERELATQTIAARDRVMNAIADLGGVDSPAGSCCWHVVGMDETLKHWATTRFVSRRISENAAPGVLLGALGALVVHYQRRRR
jgi:Domain of unknown function (DUF6456)